MKKFTKLGSLFLILIFLGSCKELNKKETTIKNSIEIVVSCGEDSDLKKYINEGWKIVKEYSEEKICSWKSVAATSNCNIEKDKGCRIIKPDKIGEEKIYLLKK